MTNHVTETIYVRKCATWASNATEVVLPMDLTDISGVVEALRGALQPPAGQTAAAAAAQVAARDG